MKIDFTFRKNAKAGINPPPGVSIFFYYFFCFQTHIFNRISEAVNRPYIFVMSHTDSIRLYLDDLIYAERQQRKTLLHTVNGIFTITDNTDRLEEQCCDYSFIVRCHNSFLVNLKYARIFNRNNLTLHDNISIPISRKYLEPVKKSFMNFIHNSL